ncbi:MAG TPA: hypothetical protein VFI08_11330 [Spirochaetia bacterium]|nr:hypothetical protein [Spirochaetia bacterium]
MRPLALLFMTVLCTGAWCQQNLAIGEDLRAYVKEHPPAYKIDGKKVIAIPEGTIDLYAYAPRTTPADMKVLVILDTYAVGVVQSVNGKEQTLFDLTGDGVLDTETDGLEIPWWVVAANTTDAQKTPTNNVKQYLDGYYQMFQGDANPVSSGRLPAYTEALLQQVISAKADNRDILYALYCCYRWGTRYRAGTASAAGYMAGSYSTRFHADHALLYLQYVESALMANDQQVAHRYLDGLLALDPGFVPAQVYRWELETDPLKKKAYLVELKKAHPAHWIVSQLPAP